MNRVTVGIPFVNDDRTLETAIRSVFAQDLRDWELVLVDDGSTDRSLEIARSIRDPRVRVVSDGENRGLPYRLNQINRLARAPYIARMDADDVMHPARLQVQAAYLDRHPAVDVVDSACFTIDTRNRILGLGNTTALDFAPLSVLRKSLLLHPACMGRREWFLQNRYDETLLRAQDWDLWFRTWEHSEFARITSPLLFYRITGSASVWDYLRKTRRSAMYHLSLIHRRGSQAVGRLGTYLVMLRIVAFHLALVPFALAQRQSRLVHRKSRKLAAWDEAEARTILSRVECTSVPGFRAPRSEMREALGSPSLPPLSAQTSRAE
jgi:glycosyltransferase involved in cell wall biosynthesis